MASRAFLRGDRARRPGGGSPGLRRCAQDRRIEPGVPDPLARRVGALDQRAGPGRPQRRRRTGQDSGRRAGHDGSQDGGGRSANGQGRRRSREPVEERVPGAHEPRNPDPDERRHRDDRSGTGHRALVRTAGIAAHRQIVGRCAAGDHQRHPGLLQAGSRQVRPRPDRLRPPRRRRRHGEYRGAQSAPEGPRADRAMWTRRYRTR